LAAVIVIGSVKIMQTAKLTVLITTEKLLVIFRQRYGLHQGRVVSPHRAAECKGRQNV